MNNQARELLSLLQRPTGVNAVADDRGFEVPRSRSLVVSSGAGGVGRSLIALQAALALGQQGMSVALLDANAGVSHTALLAGLSDWAAFDHLPANGRPEDASVSIDASVELLCGVAGALTDACSPEIATKLDDWLTQFDWCVIDAGVRTQPGVEQLLKEADVPALVTTAEPVSLAETYAALRALNAVGCDNVSLVLNQAASYDVGHRVERTLVDTTSQFLSRSTAISATLLSEPPVAAAARGRRAGRFLEETQFGQSVSSWTTRFSRAA